MDNTSEDEYLDLVDANDNVIGRKKRSEIYAENLFNFRVVNAFVVNKKGEIWIPRRPANKKLSPLCLNMSMGGHVASGESYEDAFWRETKEELNIDIHDADYSLLGYLTSAKDGVSVFMKVYEIRMEDTPDYNKDEFIEYFWLKPKEILNKIKNGDKSKSDLPKLIEIFYTRLLK